MLASNLRLGVLACVVRSAEPIGLRFPVSFAGESVIAGPILAVFAARNSVALLHEHCLDAIGRLS